jgi:DNA replication protein DnaC
MAFAKLSSSLLACKEALPARRARNPVGAEIAFVPPAGEEARLLVEHLRALRLPAFSREYEAVARQCAAEGLDHSRFLLRLAQREVEERQARRVERLVKQARFPAPKSLEEFDFAAIPSLDKRLVLQLAECEWIAWRENVIAVGGLGTGKTHLAIGLGLAACHKGLSVGFFTAASLVNELVEARAERRIMRLERQLDACRLLIIDELGYAPLPPAGAELFFEVVSRRCERGSMIITSDLPIAEWIGVFGSERLTSALLDRLSWRLHIIEMNGESYRPEHGDRHAPENASDETEPELERSPSRFSTVARFARGMMHLAADQDVP